MSATFSSLFFLLLGSLITYLVNTFISKRGNDLAEISEYIVEIARVEEAARAYWFHDPKSDDAIERAAAANLRGMLHIGGIFRERAEKLLGNSFGHYLELDSKIFDVATGGKFEQHEKTPDYARVVEVMLYCNQMRALLRKARARRFWAH